MPEILIFECAIFRTPHDSAFKKSTILAYFNEQNNTHSGAEAASIKIICNLYGNNEHSALRVSSGDTAQHVGNVQIRQIPLDTNIDLFRKIVALSVGLTSDLAEKLKLEIREDPNSGQQRRGAGQRKKKAANKKAYKMIPLNQNITLRDLGIVEMEETEIVIENWNKVGSGKKYLIAKLFHECFVHNHEYAELQKIVHLLSQSTDQFPQTIQVTRENGNLGPFSYQFVQLCDLLCGNDGSLDHVQNPIADTISLVLPRERKSRRIQLVSELWMEYSSLFSLVHNVEYESLNSNLSEPVEHEEKELYEFLSRSAPMITPSFRHSTGRRSGPAPEDSKDLENLLSRSSPMSRSLVLDLSDSSNEQSFPIHPSPVPRRRGGRRRAQARIRESETDLLFSFDMDDHSGFQVVSNSSSRGHRSRRRSRRNNDDAVFESMDYDQLVQLENVKVGVRPQVLASFPVQILTKESAQLLKESTCRVCLCSFEADESIMRLPCLHAYHVDCIQTWLASNKTCPQDMIPVD
jgi:hypothetical protein